MLNDALHLSGPQNFFFYPCKCAYFIKSHYPWLWPQYPRGPTGESTIIAPSKPPGVLLLLSSCPPLFSIIFFLQQHLRVLLPSSTFSYEIFSPQAPFLLSPPRNRAGLDTCTAAFSYWLKKDLCEFRQMLHQESSPHAQAGLGRPARHGDPHIKDPDMRDLDIFRRNFLTTITPFECQRIRTGWISTEGFRT